MVTTKSRYALRAMIILATHHGLGPVSVEKMAGRENVSEKYLSMVMGMLKTAGLVGSQRGPHGGYYLRKPPDQITAYDIVDAMDGTQTGIACVDSPKTCKNEIDCAARSVWNDASMAYTAALQRNTLAAIADTGPCPATDP